MPGRANCSTVYVSFVSLRSPNYQHGQSERNQSDALRKCLGTCAPTVSKTETVSDGLASVAFIDDKVGAFSEATSDRRFNYFAAMPEKWPTQCLALPVASRSRLIWPMCRSLTTASSATNCLRFDHAMNWLEKSIAMHSISFVSIADTKWIVLPAVMLLVTQASRSIIQQLAPCSPQPIR